MSIALPAAFCLIIFVLFVSFWRRGGAIPEGPAILTMVGITGTFLGIAIGLAGFDTNDVTASVPHLIDGMKTAVWASFAGVLTAIILKYRDALAAAREAQFEGDSDFEPGTGEDVAGLRRLIGTGENTSLLTELKLLRRDLGERITRIENALEFLAERMSRQQAKALVEALQDAELIKTPGASANDAYNAKEYVERP